MSFLLQEISEVLSGERRWCLINADCTTELPTLPDGSVAHVITDPPYSEWVHEKNGRMLAGSDGCGPTDGSRRTKIDFGHIRPEEMGTVGAEAGRLASRWVLVFCDTESASEWIRCFSAGGLEHVRVGAWIKRGATPQFSGDRPAAAFDAIVIEHARGRKRWNGGGGHAAWTHQIEREERYHTTPKPLPLMLELVELFTDPGDVVLDPFAGSGTTGVACLRLGRRFIGIEKDAGFAKVARERLEADCQGLLLRDARAGQLPLFAGGAP